MILQLQQSPATWVLEPLQHNQKELDGKPRRMLLHPAAAKAPDLFPIEYNNPVI